MNLPLLTALLSLLAFCTADCTSADRLAGAEQIPYAYNLSPLIASYYAFDQVPFAPNCTIQIYANGAPPVETAFSGSTSVLFAVETRQVFSEVTGEYADFPNGTAVIYTNVTLGVLELVPVPVTFFADVYLDYTSDTCQIYAVRAMATIPTEVLGLIINPPGIPAGLIPGLDLLLSLPDLPVREVPVLAGRATLDIEAPDVDGEVMPK